MKKILIIAPFAFGYTSHIYQALDQYQDVIAEIVYLDHPAFQYKNVAHRIQNSISKILFKKNLKKTAVTQRILKKLVDVGEQDVIFIIRADMLDDRTLKKIKSYTKKFITYYWDSTRRFPRKAAIISLFDKVYSYDKEDVKNYQLEFLTNYVFDASPLKDAHDFLFFNISTNDDRLPALEKLTQYIDAKGWSRKILVYNGSDMDVDHVELITQQKSIAEVTTLIEKSKIIVEIQRKDQIGLSFRIFEALGHRKKLITTNTDIVNYPFYHPQNILVLDENTITIPEDFVTSPYVEIDEAILKPYLIKNWVQPIFELQ